VTQVSVTTGRWTTLDNEQVAIKEKETGKIEGKNDGRIPS